MQSWRRIRSELEAMGVKPRKSLGQNFLTDMDLARRIASRLEVGAGDRVLEIGSGPGALALGLLDLVREQGLDRVEITCVELDSRLAEAAGRIMGSEPGVRIINADFLELELDALFPDRAPFKTMGNLPYMAAMPMLFKLLGSRSPRRRMALMFQKEVAERIAAGPGSKVYGVPSVKVGVRYRARVELRAGPNRFWPSPGVDSAVVVFEPLAEVDELVETELFARVVDAAFSTRRKTALNALSAPTRGFGLDRGQWMEIIRESGVEPGARAEAIAPEGFVALTRALRRTDPGPAAPATVQR